MVKPGKLEDQLGQAWQRFSISLLSGSFSLSLGADSGDACLLCRQPDDEVKGLCDSLSELLLPSAEHTLFEPAEPSFELALTKRGKLGLKVEIWLDAGNAKTGIYRWDAAGIRFFTHEEQLSEFIKQLKQDFNC